MKSPQVSVGLAGGSPCGRSILFVQARTILPLFLALMLVVSLVGISGVASAQTVVFREISYAPLGNATLNLIGTPETGVLAVENIGSSGLDGVAAELPDVCFYSARWEDLPTPSTGNLLRFRVHGILEETPGQLLGVAQFEQVGPELNLAVDLIPDGFFLNQMRVVDGGSLVYSGVIADTGVIATVATWPDEMSVVSACSDAISSSLSFLWATPTAMSIAGGPNVNADAIELFSIAFVSSFSQVDLNVANMSPVVISDAAFGHPHASAADIPESSELTLSATIPNPFNPRTEILFSILRPTSVRLTVHDMRGRLVATLFQGPMEAGEHSIIWDGTDAGGKNAGSGVYLISLVSSAEIRSQKVTLVR